MFIISSCSELEVSDRLKSNDVKTELKHFSDYSFIGEFHNAGLTLLFNHFRNYDCEGISHENYLQIITDYQKDMLYLIPNLPNDFIESSLPYIESCKTYLCMARAFEPLTNGITRSSDNNQLSLIRDSINLIINNLGVHNIIDEYEASQIQQLNNSSFSCLQGNISYDELIGTINQLIVNWEEMEYTEGSNQGIISAQALSIAKYSAEWWIENWDIVSPELDPEIAELGPQGVAQAVAFDVIGACINAAINVGNQYITWNGEGDFEMNWGNFAIDVAWGALDGSYGLSSRIMARGWKWIKGFL